MIYAKREYAVVAYPLFVIYSAFLAKSIRVAVRQQPKLYQLRFL